MLEAAGLGGVPEGFAAVELSGGGGWVRRPLSDDLAAVERLWSAGAEVPGARGRGGVSLVTVGKRQIVVRPMCRGGALGGLLGRRYPSRRRVQRELAVHAAMERTGLAVVPPLGALWRRAGLWWNLLFATERVPAVPLSQFAAAHPPARGAALRAAGRAFAAAVAAGLDHPDLHPDNILASPTPDGVRVWLIDFDRARLHRPGTVPRAVQERMLLRLARYPFRHQQLGAPRLRDRARFLQGTGRDRAGRRQTLTALQPALRRAVQRRGLAG